MVQNPQNPLMEKIMPRPKTIFILMTTITTMTTGCASIKPNNDACTYSPPVGKLIRTSDGTVKIQPGIKETTFACHSYVQDKSKSSFWGTSYITLK